MKTDIAVGFQKENRYSLGRARVTGRRQLPGVCRVVGMGEDVTTRRVGGKDGRHAGAWQRRWPV